MIKRRLKPWVKYTLFTIATTLIIFGLCKLLENDMDNHIEKISQECAEQGYGIIATYGNDGEKYYVCKK